MPNQQDIELNSSVIRRFSALQSAGKLAHAYLFIGPHDIGKSQTALGIAKMVNCEGAAGAFCDTCPSCVKINTGNHPDITVIDGETGGSIKIEQVRLLLEQSKLRPYLASKRVFIIKDAERMTQEAANAFLKTLEEPSKQSLIILTTAVPERCLDTVRSRCHAVPFEPASTDELIQMVRNEYDLSPADSRCISYFAQGSPKTARRLGEANFIDRKNGYINQFILHRPSDELIKSLLADKTETREFLDILLSWVRDALLITSGADEERIIHCDRAGDLNTFARRFTFDDLNMLTESIIKMYRQLADNLNIKLPLLIIGEQLWEK